MFKTNNLSKLYPHLNFSRVGNATLNVQTIPIVPVSVITPEVEIVVSSEPVLTVEPETCVPIASTLPNEIIVPVITNIPEPEPVQPDVIAKPKKASTRKPPGPKQRESTIPLPGERGLQNQYTLEQRRNNYIERLSRKSVKLAEREVGLVNQVLNEADNDPAKLAVEERKLKNKLKLINYAKFFTSIPEKQDNIINENEATSEIHSESEPIESA